MNANATLTPEKVYEQYIKNALNKSSAIELLISIIENSEKIDLRIQGIQELELVGADDNRAFHFLEQILLSDSIEEVRRQAAISLKRVFRNKSLDPMSWALKHEESPSPLKVIYKTLMEIINNLNKQDTEESKRILIDQINRIDQIDFKIAVNNLCLNKSLEKVNIDSLADILKNFFSYIYLRNTLWRIKFEIQECRILKINYPHGNLQEFPEALKNLSSLEVIELTYNTIRRIPKWIGKLKKLKRISLNSNFSFIKLPHSLGQLKNLKELSLWNNKVKFLPKSIGTLESLEFLNLRVNQLEEIPKTIGNLESLKVLDIYDNRLKKLPSTIGSLRSLEKLILNGNQLKSIPSTIGSLSSLKYLDLEDNELTQIPKSLGLLKSLVYLNLSRNQLSSLPNTIGLLPNLKELYLGSNNIIMYPQTLKLLERNDVKIYYESY
ncbi:MAG: hypothetical protein GF353_20585 [Candidatus Lokiarchaeota archaeon]|nr:hypothetical protein [Candidatus Lokiarchaeota archaeon]